MNGPHENMQNGDFVDIPTKDVIREWQSVLVKIADLQTFRVTLATHPAIAVLKCVEQHRNTLTPEDIQGIMDYLEQML